MRAHVRRDGRRLREPPVAHRAPERLLAAVGAHVRRQVRRLRERLVAVEAAVRLLAGVGAQVGLQGAGARVALAWKERGPEDAPPARGLGGNSRWALRGLSGPCFHAFVCRLEQLRIGLLRFFPFFD